jgi:DNA-directed RNA polymerase subunit H (RpoH/RPB5)
MSIFEKRIIDLMGLQNYELIQFLRIEILNVQGHGPTFFGRVRYARNGVEQEEGLPMDLSKGIFIATLRDEQLGEISRDELEKTLQEAAGEIIKIVRKDPSMKELLPDYDYPAYGEDCSVEKIDGSSGSILKSILKDYPYLKYDEDRSKPPDLLRCRVAKPKSPRQVEDIFEIAQKLCAETGENYRVGSYGGSSSAGDNLDEVWTIFSLRKFDFQKVKSK